MKDFPFISVVIPCRNEELFVEQCIDSVLASDYPRDKMEIIVSDGMSIDKTRQILDSYQLKYPFIKVVDNPKHIVPTAMNIAIKSAIGDYIVRLDMHSIYPSNYISRLISFHQTNDCANVGGVWETLPANPSSKARAIAAALKSPFGVGNAGYRIVENDSREFIETDTVPFGCYKRSIFNEVGYYDEQLIRNQDNELNDRILKTGAKMYLLPDLKIKYFARENFHKLFKMFYQYAYFGPLVDIKLKSPSRLRRYIPTAFFMSLVLPLIFSLLIPQLYLITILLFSIYILFAIPFSYKTSKSIKLAPYVIYAFLVSHYAYGVGYLMGFLDFNILKKHENEFRVSESR